MAKNWKHTKKLLEGLLCDKLKDRITYQLHCYRPDDDWTGHLEILLDKNRFLGLAAVSQKIQTTASIYPMPKSATS